MQRSIASGTRKCRAIVWSFADGDVDRPCSGSCLTWHMLSPLLWVHLLRLTPFPFFSDMVKARTLPSLGGGKAREGRRSET
jgi:hypothetical protein